MTSTPFDDLSHHTAAIQRMASALCGSGAEADDVGQEMWLAAHRREGDAPLAWLPWLSGTGRRIFWSRARSEARRRSREQRAAREESLPSPEERAMRMEVEQRLLQSIRQLPETQSEVVYLRFWEGLPPREIAERLGVSVGAIRTRQKRALGTLRQRLSDETPGGRDAWMGALVGFPLASLPNAGAATISLSYLGVLMTVKHFVFVLALSIIGVGWWFTRPDSEPLSNVTETGIVAEATLVDQGTETLLIAKSGTPERVSAVEPAVPEPEAEPTPEDVLIVTGRVWNVPSGGDRTAATPAVGVKVRLSFFSLGAGNEPTDVTDDSGSFRLEKNVDDYHSQAQVLAFNDEIYAYASERIQWNKDSVGPLVVDIYRIAFGDLDGQVVDRSGRPVAGARMVFMEGDSPVRETVSDAQGQFAFSKSEKHGYVLGELPGWTTLVSPAVRKDEAGSWMPVRVVMCESSALRIRVETEEGEPVGGIRLLLDLSHDEPLGREQGGPSSSYRAMLWGETNVKGIAMFPVVWAGVKLRLRPSFEGINFFIEREMGGNLLTEASSSAGRPISLLPKSERQFTLQVKPARIIKCRVVGPDGAPFAKAHVRLISESQVSMGPSSVGIWTMADAEGRCEIKVQSPLPLGPALLSASDLPTRYLPGQPNASPIACSVSLHLDRLPKGEVLLKLAPTYAIAGTLIDAKGNPLKGRVGVNPIGSELVGRMLTTGFAPMAMTSKQGRFSITGLPEGRFNLTAKSSKLAKVVVQDVRAGTDDLVIRMEEQLAAHVDVRFDTGGVPMKQYVTLVGWHTPARGLEPQFPALPRNATFHDPIGWPPELQGLWYGGGNSANETPGNEYWLTPTDVPHKELNLEPGSYWFGAQARAEDGTLFAQMGTGLVQIAEGNYSVMFKMRPCVELSGRVLGTAAVNDLALALAFPDGKLLPLNIGRESMQSIVELGAMGDFHLKCVPAGKYELRIGTRAALELGGASVTRAIELVHGKPLQVEIDL